MKIFSSGLHVKGYVVLSNEPDKMVEDVYLVLGLENTIATNGNKVTGAEVSGSNTSWYWLGAAEGTGSVTGSLPDTKTGENATIITKNLDNKEEYGINLSSVKKFPTIVANETTYSYDTEGTKEAGTYSLEPTELKAHKANDNCGHSEKATQLHWHMGYRAVLNDGSKAKYTVTFESNGDIYVTKSVTNGEVVTAPETNPVLPGYTFSGWVTKDGKAYGFNSAVTEDITLTAKWTPIQYWTPTVTPQTPADDTDNTDNTNDSSTEDETIIDIEEDDTPLSPTPDTEPATDTDESVNLEDEDVPMAELPDEETSPAEPSYEEASLTDISGEDTPLAEVPVTGDSLMVWILLAGVSGIALVLLTFTEKKRKKDRAA